VSATNHPVHAFLYDPLMGLVDRAGMGDRRRRLVAEARGEVVEVGGGTGRNLPHYRDVDRVVVLEPDAAMRTRLLERVDSAAVPVEVHESGIEDSSLPDGFADTVVVSLVLCTVESPAAALAQIKRILKPGGRLLFLEHVAVPGLRGRMQSVLTPLWSRTAGAGCHLDRPTLDHIRSAGFAITDCHRSGVLVQGIAVPSARFPAPAADVSS
jgi:SAM-dependent methyltransferase